MSHHSNTRRAKSPMTSYPKAASRYATGGVMASLRRDRLTADTMTPAYKTRGGRPVFNFVSEGRAFADSALILATGFYQYIAPRDAKVTLKDQHFFELTANKWLWIAGIVKQNCFTMLTTAPGPDMTPYHERQICVLRPQDGMAWLTLSRPERELLCSPPQGYRKHGRAIEVFLVHPAGPFWKNKDRSEWSVPKGLIGGNEDALLAAKREFQEETGFELDGDFRLLGTFRQPGGKH
jgi:hypothetical protein